MHNEIITTSFHYWLWHIDLDVRTLSCWVSNPSTNGAFVCLLSVRKNKDSWAAELYLWFFPPSFFLHSVISHVWILHLDCFTLSCSYLTCCSVSIAVPVSNKLSRCGCWVQKSGELYGPDPEPTPPSSLCNSVPGLNSYMALLNPSNLLYSSLQLMFKIVTHILNCGDVKDRLRNGCVYGRQRSVYLKYNGSTQNTAKYNHTPPPPPQWITQMYSAVL